jgi:hypothetical protein
MEGRYRWKFAANWARARGEICREFRELYEFYVGCEEGNQGLGGSAQSLVP